MSLYTKRLFVPQFIILTLLIASCSSCQSNKSIINAPSINTPVMSYTQVSPLFDADSAYFFVEKQVSFGPRVPNSVAHIACGDYLVSKLEAYGAQVVEQKTILKTYAGLKLNTRNIIGVYNPEKEKRVLLFAH